MKIISVGKTVIIAELYQIVAHQRMTTPAQFVANALPDVAILEEGADVHLSDTVAIEKLSRVEQIKVLSKYTALILIDLP